MAPCLPVVFCGRVSCYVDVPRRLRWSEPQSEDVWKALELLEPNVPTICWEEAGQVAWMFLAVPWQVSLKDQAQWVQQLKCQEEELERGQAAAECMLQGPDGSLPSSWLSGVR